MSYSARSVLLSLPAGILSFEFFLGGLPRIFPSLLPRVSARIDEKYPGTVNALWPVIPISDPVWHRRFIGVFMVATGWLLARPVTRGRDLTLGMVVFLTGCGVVSQYRMGIPYRVPVMNMCLGGVVWWLERAKLRGEI